MSAGPFAALPAGTLFLATDLYVGAHRWLERGSPFPRHHFYPLLQGLGEVAALVGGRLLPRGDEAQAPGHQQYFFWRDDTGIR